jgi:hypothetical protein
MLPVNGSIPSLAYRSRRRDPFSMNRAPSSHPFPPVGEKVPVGRMRGILYGSWHRFTSKLWSFSIPKDLSARRKFRSDLAKSGGAGFPVFGNLLSATKV